ncbi:hypothetical protein M514_12884 [Trichuris suis]|uniref:Uncharacterized protein n=1 Tax=Trichuris suis TaxID=68888 RepID=A0A085MT64_9BILA|nr:hypothetical protein M514_12884 [Trichuris suis]
MAHSITFAIKLDDENLVAKILLPILREYHAYPSFDYSSPISLYASYGSLSRYMEESIAQVGCRKKYTLELYAPVRTHLTYNTSPIPNDYLQHSPFLYAHRLDMHSDATTDGFKRSSWTRSIIYTCASNLPPVAKNVHFKEVIFQDTAI